MVCRWMSDIDLLENWQTLASQLAFPCIFQYIAGFNMYEGGYGSGANAETLY